MAHPLLAALPSFNATTLPTLGNWKKTKACRPRPTVPAVMHRSQDAPRLKLARLAPGSGRLSSSRWVALAVTASSVSPIEPLSDIPFSLRAADRLPSKRNGSPSASHSNQTSPASSEGCSSPTGNSKIGAQRGQPTLPASPGVSWLTTTTDRGPKPRQQRRDDLGSDGMKAETSPERPFSLVLGLASASPGAQATGKWRRRAGGRQTCGRAPKQSPSTVPPPAPLVDCLGCWQTCFTRRLAD